MSNREILFRGKRKDNGEWIEGYLLKYSPIYDEVTYILPLHQVCVSDIEVDPETVCQCTGLTDKNGRKIFEGDIVKREDRRNGLYIFKEQPTMNCKVVWTDKYGWDTKPECGYFHSQSAKDSEVIGNIFDNPELLEVKNEQ